MGRQPQVAANAVLEARSASSIMVVIPAQMAALSIAKVNPRRTEARASSKRIKASRDKAGENFFEETITVSKITTY
jgi:hypothetical protein